MSHLYAVIAGVGPGTGAAIAKKFGKAYSVVLLGRTLTNLKLVEQEISSDGGRAICVEADVSSHDSMAKVLGAVTAQLGNNAQCAVSHVFGCLTKAFMRNYDVCHLLTTYARPGCDFQRQFQTCLETIP